MLMEEKENLTPAENTEKIGFNSAPPDPKIKGKKFKSVVESTPIRKWSRLFVVLGIIFTILTGMYLFLPIFNGLFIFIAAIIIIIIIACAVVFTLFFGLLSEGFRQWIGSTWSIIDKLVNVGNNIPSLSPYFPAFAYPAIFFDVMAIILSSIGRAKEKKGYISYIIAMSIHLVLAIIYLVGYYVNGCQIVH